MQVTQVLLRQANCPLSCPPNKVGSDLTHKVKIKDDHVRKDGTSSIYLQCFLDGVQVRVPTGLSVKPSYFNKDKQRVNRKCELADDYNLLIDGMITRIHELRVKSRLGKLNLNPQVLKDFVTESSLSIDFLAYMKWKIEQRKSDIAYNTYRQHRSTFKILSEWQSPIPFSLISDNFFNTFKSTLKARGNGINTIGNKVKIIKVYLNFAKDDGLEFKFPQKSLKGMSAEGKKEALSLDELKRAIRLYKEGYLPNNLHQTLRCFLFSCLTGLRYGDIKNLKSDQIIGKYLLVLPEKTKKNGKYIKIPINTAAEALLDRDRLKPLGEVISNQKMNYNLKNISSYIGVRKNLSYHVSRHTFASIFLELGGSVEVLQNLMGHSKLELTMIYTHIGDQRKNEQIGFFDKLIE
jgi:integrase/recombinase XerD